LLFCNGCDSAWCLIERRSSESGDTFLTLPVGVFAEGDRTPFAVLLALLCKDFPRKFTN